MLLSILIPSLKTRAHFLTRMLEMLGPQIGRNVEILTDVDDGERSIGEKRQRLLMAARSEYVVFIDDDDQIPDDYCRRILTVIQQEPEIIGFHVREFHDGQLKTICTHSHGQRVNPLGEDRKYRGVRHRHKIPNHLNPIRLELARVVGFKPWNMREDSDYSHRLRDTFPMIREIFIDRVMYDYLLRSDRTGEITNQKRMVTT